MIRIGGKHLAELSGVAGRSLARYMTGEREPNSSVVTALAGALGVTPAYIYAEGYRRATESARELAKWAGI